MFYSVDVETGHTIPQPGALLTVGIVAVDKVIDDWVKVDSLYLHLAYNEEVFDEDTLENFWKDDEKVSEEARKEAFDWSLSRLHPASAAVMISEFVSQYSAQKDSIFVANPASFDHAWIDMLFASSGLKIPFSHRTLCLRSMQFGMVGGDYGGSRSENNNKPDIPHHALYDALAQADDLIDMLNLL